MRFRRNVKLTKKRRRIVFNVDVAKRRKGRKGRPAGRGPAARGWAALAAAAAAAAALCVFGPAMARGRFNSPPRFTVRTIEVTNEDLLTRGEIAALSRVRVGDNLLDVDLQAIRDRLRAHPDIRDAVVSRRIPGGILIRVYERTPVAALYAGETRHVLDEEGCVLSRKKACASRALPVIAGIPAEAVRAGRCLRSAAARRALDVVKGYQELGLDRQTDLVSVEMGDPDNIVLRTGTIDEIRLGDDNIADRLKTLSFVLAQRKLRGLDAPASYMDLRWKDVAEMPAQRDAVSMR